MSIRNNIWLIVIFFMCSCNIFRPKKPTNVDVAMEHFTNVQYDQLDKAINEWIDTSLEYNIRGMRHISNSNWLLIDPIYIRSDYRRAIGLLLRWDNEVDSKLNSLTWICGFRHNEEWYFYRPSVSQPIYKKINNQKYDPLKDKNNLSTIKDYTKGYLKYDKVSREWVINDRWFRGFMDNASRLDKSERDLTDEQILALPDEYWIDKYMDYQRMHNRYLELIKANREEEDQKRAQGVYTEAEWSEIMRLRKAETYEDWKELREKRKIFFQDSIMMALEDKIMKRIGQGKYYKKSGE